MANFDSNLWYHLYIDGQENSALIGSNLFNKGMTGTTFMQSFNESRSRQHWQLFAVDSEYYVLRSGEGEENAALGTLFSVNETTPGQTRPAMKRIAREDNSIYWKISPWGDGTFFMTNKQNGTQWHLSQKPNTLMVMDSNVEGKPEGQRWSFESFNKTIDNSKYSSINFPSGSPSTSSSAPATSSTGSPSETNTSPKADDPPSDSGASGTKLAVGLAIGLAAVIALVVLGLFLWQKRKRNQGHHPNTAFPYIADANEGDKVYEADHNSASKHELFSQQQHTELPLNSRPTELPLNLPPAELPSSPLQKR